MRFTALFHHVYRLETLKRAYFGLNRKAAPGVDGVTWQQYGKDLEVNLSKTLPIDWREVRTERSPPGGRIFPKPMGGQDF
jgi:hypothetical protein